MPSRPVPPVEALTPDYHGALDSIQNPGGQTTISPPAKVKNSRDDLKILASGVDSLTLALYISWTSQAFLNLLRESREKAVILEKSIPLILHSGEDDSPFHFNLLPHGANGYKFLLLSAEYALKIGDWESPKSRPSAMVEIRSEALWHIGFVECFERILALFRWRGAELLEIKPSRMDLCADALVPDSFLSMDLMKYAVTRSDRRVPYFSHSQLTGIQFGRGQLVGRIYDKALEIQRRSKKDWMFAIWDIDAVPTGKKVVRFEFQVRREALRQMALNDIQEARAMIDNLWSYCSRNWLKFQDNPGNHHTMRTTFPWWEAIQNGFLGVQDSCPLIRNKAIDADCRQLACQAFGNITSLLALLHVEVGSSELSASREELISKVIDQIILADKTDADIQSSICLKQAKYYRSKIKTEHAERERARLGFRFGSQGGQGYECSE